MSRFYSQQIYALDNKEYFPDKYNEITHSLVATILSKKRIRPQISTSPRFASACFTEQEILEKFCKTEYLLTFNTHLKVELNYKTRIRIYIENIPIELPDIEVKTLLADYTTVIGKTYYPGIKHNNKYFKTGTRIYQFIKLQQDIPKDIYTHLIYLINFNQPH